MWVDYYGILFHWRMVVVAPVENKRGRFELVSRDAFEWIWATFFLCFLDGWKTQAVLQLRRRFGFFIVESSVFSHRWDVRSNSTIYQNGLKVSAHSAQRLFPELTWTGTYGPYFFILINLKSFFWSFFWKKGNVYSPCFYPPCFSLSMAAPKNPYIKKFFSSLLQSQQTELPIYDCCILHHRCNNVILFVI